MHNWKFIQKGGFDQVIIECGEDIANIGDLNRKLWATLSCPIDGVYFDAKTLEFIDVDNDGKIRITEILSAVDFLKQRLKSLDTIIPSAKELRLDAISDETDDGKQIFIASKQILASLDKADYTTITLNDVLVASEHFLHTSFNGDGIITNDGLDDGFGDILENIMCASGQLLDANGKNGINIDILEDFEKKLSLFENWQNEFANENFLEFSGAQEAKEAVELFDTLKDKIDSYFTWDSLIAYDSSVKYALNHEVEFYREFVNSDFNALNEKLIDMPISIAKGDGNLNILSSVNPKYTQKMYRFNELFVVKLFGHVENIDKYQFELIVQKVAQYKDILSKQTEYGIESIDEKIVEKINEMQAFIKLRELLKKDSDYCEMATYLSDVEKMLRLCENFYSLINNFVVFRDFYATGHRAIFEAGTLFIDGRSCDLCVKVNDIAKHAELASLSKTYLLYCDCSREAGKHKMTIAAAMTNGDSDNLMIGRNGVFYDRNGLDWDASIIKIMDYPISVKQAFWLPYKKVGEFIRTQLEKFAKTREAGTITMAQSATKLDNTKVDPKTGVVPQAHIQIAPPPTPVDVGKFAGIFAAIGLAIGAIGTAIASILGGFLALKFWQMPLVIAGLILTISLPSMLFAWLKLRQRNLGPLLDACGWAINTRAKINVPFGATLTQVAELPKGSSRTLKDPFEEKDHRTKLIFGGIILIVLFMIYVLFFK